MAIWSLKCGDFPDQTYSVTLDSVDYDIRVRWNSRDESWQCTLGLSGQDPSITFKITNGIDLLIPYKYKEEVPDGKLFMADMVKENGRPTFDDTGVDKRFQLIYIDAEIDQD